MKPGAQRKVASSTLAEFGRYTRELHRYLLRRLGKPEDADDLAQDVYLQLLRMNQDKLVEKPLAYLYGIAAHIVADFKDKHAREQGHVPLETQTLTHPEGEDDERPTDNSGAPLYDVLPDDLAERLNLQRQIDRALAALSPLQAAIILAHKRDGLSLEEVAVRLNISVHTARKYLTRAKARIRMMPWER